MHVLQYKCLTSDANQPDTAGMGPAPVHEAESHACHAHPLLHHFIQTLAPPTTLQGTCMHGPQLGCEHGC